MSKYSDVLKAKERYTEELTEYVNKLRTKTTDEQLSVYAAMREIDISAVKKFQMFYIGSPAEMLLPNYIDRVVDFGVISSTNNKPIFSDRYIIPILDTSGKVLNLVGYKKDADERYIYGTSKYYMRTDTLYGLENLELAYKMGYGILTEGITDAQRIRSLGYPNCFAMCGTHSSDYITAQLSRLKYGIIRIPDRDKAGLRALKGWKHRRTITVYVSYGNKDADQMLRTEKNIELFRYYMEACKKELLATSLTSIAKEVTII